MGKGGNRPKLKAAENGTEFNVRAEPADYEKEHPKFCFRYIQSGFDPKSLAADKKSDLIEQLQSLSALPWKEIKIAPRHGLGTEQIAASSINAPIPPAFDDEDKFMFFRYSGKLPMGGMRVRDIFHVMWVAQDFDAPYKH